MLHHATSPLRRAGVFFGSFLIAFVVAELAGAPRAFERVARWASSLDTTTLLAAVALPLAPLLATSAFVLWRRHSRVVDLSSLSRDERPRGELVVDRRSVCDLVLRRAAEVDGVDARGCTVELLRRQGRWKVRLDVAVSEAALERVHDSMRRRIDSSLAFHTGYELGDFRVRATLTAPSRPGVEYVHAR